MVVGALRDSELGVGMKETSDRWRWYTGGGIVFLAVAIGCATAVDLRRQENRQAHSAESPAAKQDLRQPGSEPRHNGGKVQVSLPVRVSFEGPSEIALKRTTNVTIEIYAETDITRLQGYIEGIDGLKGMIEYDPIEIPELREGKSIILTVTVPAVTGSLVVRLVGDVQMPGDSGPGVRSGAFNLKVIGVENRKSTNTFSSKAAGERNPTATQVDSTGQVVQPMESKQRTGP